MADTEQQAADRALAALDELTEQWADKIGWRRELDELAHLSELIAGRRLTAAHGSQVRMFIHRQRALIDRWVRQAFQEGVIAHDRRVLDLTPLDQLLADKARLDFLDQLNARLNAHHGTTYRWEMTMNHNVNRLSLHFPDVDLNDAKAHGLPSCRNAIDVEMRRIEGTRRTMEKADA